MRIGKNIPFVSKLRMVYIEKFWLSSWKNYQILNLKNELSYKFKEWYIVLNIILDMAIAFYTHEIKVQRHLVPPSCNRSRD